MALYLKSCNRCGGDMNQNSDFYGEYRLCIQCGNMVDIPKTPAYIPVDIGTVKQRRRRRKAA